MRKFFLLLLSLNTALISAAQNNLPSVYSITTDSAEHLNLNDSEWQMLEDKTGKLTIGEVSRPPVIDQFHANTVPKEGVNVYWFRYRIKNILARQIDIIIPENLPSYADVYIEKSPDVWAHKNTGRYVPWSQRDDLKRFLSLRYTLQPGEEVLMYGRGKWAIPHAKPSNFSPDILLANKVVQEYFYDVEPSALSPFMFGIFLVAAFLNLYFFIIVRERVYLYFSLAVAFESFKKFLDSTDIFFREQPVIGNYVWYVCQIFSLFFFVHVVRHFLETFKYTPRWDKWLIGVSIYAPVFISLTRLDIISMDEVYRDA